MLKVCKAARCQHGAHKQHFESFLKYTLLLATLSHELHKMEVVASGSFLEVPSKDCFAHIADLQTAAFAENFTCDGIETGRANAIAAYHTYEQDHPAKLQHCRVIKSRDGLVVAACQLQADGDPGDITLPSNMRHTLQPGEVYIEWIACHPDHVGKGHGSALLQWAHEFSTHELHAQQLTLSVMQANTGAVRLYERKGFVIQPDARLGVCGRLLQSCFVFCFMGCRYWTLLFMVKELHHTSTPQAASDPKRAVTGGSACP